MRNFLIIVALTAISQTASAGVQSLSKPVDMTTSKGQNYVKVDVTCDNSDLRPAIIKRSGSIQWCSFADSSLCAKSKMTLALKTCQSRHLAKLRKLQGDSEDKAKSKKAKSKKAVVAKKPVLEIEREKIEIEKQRVELEKQKVILQQLEAELQKLELELERDSKAK